MSTLIQLRNNHAALRVGEYTQVRADNDALLSFLRVSQEETVLVIINLGDEAVRDYALSLTEGPLSGSYQGVLLLGNGTVKNLRAGSTGGFEDYQPLGAVPANGVIVIQLQSR